MADLPFRSLPPGALTTFLSGPSIDPRLGRIKAVLWARVPVMIRGRISYIERPLLDGRPGQGPVTSRGAYQTVTGFAYIPGNVEVMWKFVRDANNALVWQTPAFVFPPLGSHFVAFTDWSRHTFRLATRGAPRTSGVSGTHLGSHCGIGSYFETGER